MGIEYASVLLDDADSLVEGRHSVVSPIGVAQDCGQIQSQLLWMELGCEIVGQTLLLASWDLDIVPCCRQVADDARTLRVEVWRPETAANEVDSNCFAFFVGEGEKCLCGLAVHELDAEDLGRRKRCRDGDGEV